MTNLEGAILNFIRLPFFILRTIPLLFKTQQFPKLMDWLLRLTQDNRHVIPKDYINLKAIFKLSVSYFTKTVTSLSVIPFNNTS